MGFTDTLFVVERSVYGRNQWVRVAMINFHPEDSRVIDTNITVAAVITDPDCWAVDFNDNKLPLGCYGEGFVVKEGIATHYIQRRMMP